MFNSIRRRPGQGNTVNLLNLFLTLAVMAIFLLGCNFKQDRSVERREAEQPDRIVEVREAEHKAARSPNKKYTASILPDGLQVSFHTTQGHLGFYTFPHKEFRQGEPVFLLSPGSPELLPMRVLLIKGAPNDLNEFHDYRIEWLDQPPANAGGTRVVRSFQTDPEKDILPR